MTVRSVRDKYITLTRASGRRISYNYLAKRMHPEHTLSRKQNLRGYGE